MHIEWEYNYDNYVISLISEEASEIMNGDTFIDLPENKYNDHMVSSIVNDLNILIESNIRLKEDG